MKETKERKNIREEFVSINLHFPENVENKKRENNFIFCLRNK